MINMGILKEEDIVGYKKDGKIIHTDCAEDIDDLNQEDIITKDDLEKSENSYFCDICGKKLI